ncbi:hypothetical protein HHO41_02210 [Bacillus sp. DNRA2]|uniref:hypothetical protein n=1 Tax=Bacillus sp. DNRA2 TaxID=2723053 RepID=UPI00145E5E0E|nr:hypothetical protein [Bacillus sp. DNRA2]NMD69086.1 hypothetical protein [Bacillus sp. DNRA2]
MVKLIDKLYNLTLTMKQALESEQYQELDELLDERNSLMAEIDRAKGEGHQYSEQELSLLEEIKAIDNHVARQLTKALAVTEGLINQQKINKQVSKKFQPYSKQTSGVFFDKKK